MAMEMERRAKKGNAGITCDGMENGYEVREDSIVV